MSTSELSVWLVVGPHDEPTTPPPPLRVTTEERGRPSPLFHVYPLSLQDPEAQHFHRPPGVEVALSTAGDRKTAASGAFLYLVLPSSVLAFRYHSCSEQVYLPLGVSSEIFSASAAPCRFGWICSLFYESSFSGVSNSFRPIPRFAFSHEDFLVIMMFGALPDYLFHFSVSSAVAESIHMLLPPQYLHIKRSLFIFDFSGGGQDLEVFRFVTLIFTFGPPSSAILVLWPDSSSFHLLHLAGCSFIYPCFFRVSCPKLCISPARPL